MIDIAIIGAGPAGMTASVYARRAGYSVTVFELGMPGGQLSTTDKIENFPGYPEGLPGAELGMKFYEHAQAFGAEFVFEQVVRVEADGAVKKVVTNNGTEEKEYEARAIIIATGAHPRTLGVPGEDTFRGHGVSYCGTCDGFFFRGKDVCVVGGGVGCAIALPIAQALHAQGTKVTGIVGFRNKDLVILEDEFRACCDEFILMTDDGSYGDKGVVTAPLEQKIVDGANFDEVITIGPLIMMKFVVKTTKPHNVKTVVSMNPIMVDGTGMCGGCRLTVGGQTKFACVDGPDFDGFEVDFDEAMHRGTMYKPFEAHAREAECNLLKQEVQ